MKNFQNFSRTILTFLGYTLYSLIFTLPSYSSIESGEWECKEMQSYNIKGKLNWENSNNKNPAFKTQFNENVKKNLKDFKVTYDLKNRIATINGSHAILTGGENNHDIYNNEVHKKEDGIYTSKTIKKNDLYPVIIFSEYSLRKYKKERNAGLFKDRIIVNSDRNIIRNYFIVDEFFRDRSKFTSIIYSDQINRITNKKSNKENPIRREYNKKSLIELSTGWCDKVKNKN